MTRIRCAMVALALTLAFGLVDRAHAEPWTMSERGTVTRQDLHPAGPPPNPLRHVPDELLVKLRPGLPPAAAARALATVPAHSRKRFRAVEHLYHVKLAPGTQLGPAIRALRRHPDVVYAEANFVVEALITPNDPQYPSQWAYGSGGGMRAFEAWDVTVGSAGVVVAVLDTGLDYTHLDLVDNAFRNEVECSPNGLDDDGNGVVDDCRGFNAITGAGDPMDDEGHGTHVAGTIGAAGNNLLGVTGVNWTVRILPCKFLDVTGSGDVAGAIACLDYVAAMKDRGVNVVASNNSWGGGLASQALADAIAAQRDRGILFVAAAGNSGADNDTLRTYPCSYELANVLCVAANDQDSALAWFSNYGRGTVHLAAPGVNILSTYPGNGYEYLSGTSMATPHVTGTIALLYAEDPTAAWHVVRNKVLAGADITPSSFDTTISGGRLNAGGATRCSSLLRRIRPSATQVTGAGPVVLSMYSINCGLPWGQPNVTVVETGEMLALQDGGLGADETAGDAIYTLAWTPPSAGTFTLRFADSSIVTVQADPILKPGFPVQTWTGAGSYQGGQGLHVLVGNIDSDPGLEILVTALAQGPLYAFKADGSIAPGWPVLDPPGAAYPTLGQLTSDSAALDIVAGHFASQARLSAYSGSGTPLPGWPRPPANYMASPPTTADVDGDGVDEIFTDEEDWHLHAYRADATPVTGWPTTGFVGGQERSTSAIADLDGDGRLDIVSVSGWTSPGVYVFAYRHDGTALPGFPVLFSGNVHTYPVVGDVDGDGVPEIVVTASGGRVLILSNTGALKNTLFLQGTWYYATAPALADLDGDGVPEIIVQTNTHLNVGKGDGSVLTGWPRALPSFTWLGNASPVVGDVDGDGLPEIVTVVSDNGGGGGSLLVVRRDGTLLQGFPRHIAGLGTGTVPAIADIDGDGRNDIIVASDYWNGTSGYYDKVWAFSLGGPTPHGPILWGQLMGGPKHHGRYGAAPAVVGSVLTVTRAGAGSGTVTSSPIGINCGADCSERFVNGTVVTLTATPTAPATFGAWGGACAGQSNPCTVTITEATSVTATFEQGLTLFTLTVARAGTGSGTVTSVPAGITCGSDCSEDYAGGTPVILTATPSAGAIFSGWSGACAGQGNPCSVTMSTAHAVAVTFKAVFNLAVFTAGTGTGTVTSAPAGLTCPGDCTEEYETGTSVTLTATPAEGSIFSAWEGDCGGSSPICSVSMTTFRSVTATFTALHPLAVTTAGSGSVTSNPAGIACGSQCSAAFPSGSFVALTATPAAGWLFAGWSGACAGTASTCTVTMNGAQSVSATFNQIFYTLTTITSGTGSVASSPGGIACPGDCAQAYASGTTVVLTATAGAGYVFDAWTGCAGTGNVCTITMSGHQTVTASFGIAQTLTVTTSGTGTGTVTSSDGGIGCGADCSEVYPRNRVVTLTATPTNGSTFQHWSGACNGQSPTCTVTMSANGSVTARFKR